MLNIALLNKNIKANNTKELSALQKVKIFRFCNLQLCEIALCNFATYFDVRDQTFDLAFANDVTSFKENETIPDRNLVSFFFPFIELYLDLAPSM